MQNIRIKFIVCNKNNFLEAKNYCFQKKICILSCFALPWKSTREEIGSQGKKMPPMRGKEGPWGRNDQPIAGRSLS